MLRAVAAAIALQQDFDLDAVEDVKLAVDEAATRLITDSTSESVLVCVFEPGIGDLTITLSAATRGDAPTGRPRSFGWHVLNSLTDSVSVSSDTDTDGTNITAIELTMSESSAAR